MGSENNSEDSGIDNCVSDLPTKNDFITEESRQLDEALSEEIAAALSNRLCSIQEADELDSDDDVMKPKTKSASSGYEPMRITFKHSKNRSTALLIPKTDDNRVIHPGDIGREKTVLKSILKPPSRTNSVSEPEDLLSASYGSTSYGSSGSPCSSDEVSSDQFGQSPTNKRVSFSEAVSERVIESKNSNHHNHNNNTNGHKKKSKKKRVSKFKQSRTR